MNSNNINNINNSMTTIPENRGFLKSVRLAFSSLAEMTASGAVTARSMAGTVESSTEDLTKLTKDVIGGAQASVEEWHLKCRCDLKAFQKDANLYVATQRLRNRREWLANLTEAEIQSLPELIEEEDK